MVVIHIVHLLMVQFYQAFYRASVLESAAVGTSILRLSASDADTHATPTVTFTALLTGGQDYLDVDKTTGVVFISNNLDHETLPRLDLTVRASDNGDPELTSDVNVTVNVIDVNDNSPVFVKGIVIIKCLDTFVCYRGLSDLL